MPIREKIENHLKEAIKNKEKTRVSTLRLMLAAIKDRDIANRNSENQAVIKDDEIVKALRKMLKQRKESAEIYKKNNREDLFKIEDQEIKIITTFLPQQLSGEEIRQICEKTVKSVGATSSKDIGKVMGMLKKSHADVIDFSKVSKIVKEILK